MTHGKCWLAGAVFAVSMFASAARAADTGDPAVFGVFAGSTPCGDALRVSLQLPAEAGSPVEWSLTLHQDPATKTPTSYRLRYNYSRPVPGKPNKGERTGMFEKEGRWTLAKGAAARPNAAVYEISGLPSLVEIDRNLLHVLNPDGSLMVGTGGWSYSLNRAEASEERLGPSPALLSRPSISYKLSPLSTGPSVFGVFEGRTPAQGIARQLNIDVGDSFKLKWRVTLFQDPETRAPTTYKLEGSLHWKARREGNWSIVRGTAADPNAVVYRLEPAGTEAAVMLLKGDDNVLFFLDQNRNILVGHADFSYTLNRNGVLPAGAND